MDSIEATKMVMSRIQKIDPENASKIMGYILIQDHGEKEIIRLAFGPENLLASAVKQAKAAFLHLSSSPSHPRIVIPPLSPWCSSKEEDAIVFPASDWRSCSVNDSVDDDDDDDDDGGGWKPCMYFARGFCKNGTSCKFLHRDGFGDDLCLGSSSPIDDGGFEHFLRMKAIHHQRLAAAAAAAGGVPHPSYRFLNDTPRSPSAVAAMMMGDGRFRPDRHDLALAAVAMRLGNSSSRQIYLTFPADSTFKEEDVSNYFSIFGPVQDVRIPYQQKRMFGFVTFVLPETVKAILAKGNPHFVCDSRVLVKPYKDKGKIPDKKHHQHQIERGDFAALESAEPFDHIPFGARMFNHDMMLRKKLEEDRAELQQAIDFQERNLMNMQLTTPDHQLQSHPPHTNQRFVHHNNIKIVSGDEITEGCDSKLLQEVNDDVENNSSNNRSGKESPEQQSFFDHILPDNLFASPTKSAAVNMQEADDANINQTSRNMKSCYFQMPRSVCGQEASH